jgi:GGDEF domain-containing protein
LFFLDLERFRNINDSLGRKAGDSLLKQVAEWLSHDVGDANLLARLGADHFAILLPELKQEVNVARLLDRRIAAFLDHPFRLNDRDFRIAASRLSSTAWARASASFFSAVVVRTWIASARIGDDIIARNHMNSRTTPLPVA